uniref:Phospholipase A2-like central domain-containing protein n=1 Tax=Eptatretus burgeri TaxID=7764 RepID=A0A8C4QBT7_EPTBU
MLGQHKVPEERTQHVPQQADSKQAKRPTMDRWLIWTGLFITGLRLNRECLRVQALPVLDNNGGTPGVLPSGNRWLSHSARSKRLAYPGTLWCGTGTLAESFDDLGEYTSTDRCCRKHDTCEYHINGFESKYGYQNYRWYTISHCDCDLEFKKCLLTSNETDAARDIGQTFFNMIGTPCFDFEETETCAERSWYGGCKRHQKTKVAAVREQELYHFQPFAPSTASSAENGDDASQDTMQKNMSSTLSPGQHPGLRVPGGIRDLHQMQLLSTPSLAFKDSPEFQDPPSAELLSKVTGIRFVRRWKRWLGICRNKGLSGQANTENCQDYVNRSATTHWERSSHAGAWMRILDSSNENYFYGLQKTSRRLRQICKILSCSQRVDSTDVGTTPGWLGEHAQNYSFQNTNTRWAAASTNSNLLIEANYNFQNDSQSEMAQNKLYSPSSGRNCNGPFKSPNIPHDVKALPITQCQMVNCTNSAKVISKHTKHSERINSTTPGGQKRWRKKVKTISARVFAHRRGGFMCECFICRRNRRRHYRSKKQIRVLFPMFPGINATYRSAKKQLETLLDARTESKSDLNLNLQVSLGKKLEQEDRDGFLSVNIDRRKRCQQNCRFRPKMRRVRRNKCCRRRLLKLFVTYTGQKR